jgi:hypothetical protein
MRNGTCTSFCCPACACQGSAHAGCKGCTPLHAAPCVQWEPGSAGLGCHIGRAQTMHTIQWCRFLWCGSTVFDCRPMTRECMHTQARSHACMIYTSAHSTASLDCRLSTRHYGNPGAVGAKRHSKHRIDDHRLQPFAFLDCLPRYFQNQLRFWLRTRSSLIASMAKGFRSMITFLNLLRYS